MHCPTAPSLNEVHGLVVGAAARQAAAAAKRAGRLHRVDAGQEHSDEPPAQARGAGAGFCRLRTTPLGRSPRLISPGPSPTCEGPDCSSSSNWVSPSPLGPVPVPSSPCREAGRGKRAEGYGRVLRGRRCGCASLARAARLPGAAAPIPAPAAAPAPPQVQPAAHRAPALAAARGAPLLGARLVLLQERLVLSHRRQHGAQVGARQVSAPRPLQQVGQPRRAAPLRRPAGEEAAFGGCTVG